MWTKHSAPLTLSQERRKADAAEAVAMKRWADKKAAYDHAKALQENTAALNRMATALERFGPDA